MNKIFIIFINFYRKFLSLFSYGSCRFYPTCSAYAIDHFKNSSFFKALFLTIYRVLRCNQLCKGGFDYPIVYKDFSCVKYGKIVVKYWFIKTKTKDKYILIRNKNDKQR
ncbi:MAG: membrane protein insertion efficiency factor YidD [Campylobacteraceae bacterium 4484_166]|nr:MAG: membrane protein insertion efficiency factor YidD [Campylobacteraceae bacterium 4484_166]